MIREGGGGHCVPLMVWVSEGFMYLLFGGGGGGGQCAWWCLRVCVYLNFPPKAELKQCKPIYPRSPPPHLTSHPTPPSHPFHPFPTSPHLPTIHPTVHYTYRGHIWRTCLPSDPWLHEAGPVDLCTPQGLCCMHHYALCRGWSVYTPANRLPLQRMVQDKQMSFEIA